MLKKVSALTLSLCVLMTSSAFVSAEDNSSCGEGLSWRLENGTLYIEGSGDMYDYYYDSPPWASWHEGITDIIIKDGVTGIGAEAFDRCHGLLSVSIPQSVSSIGEAAFYECEKLESVKIPEGVKRIRERTFKDCLGLKSVYLPQGLEAIDMSAFEGCGELEGIDLPRSIEGVGDLAFYGCKNIREIAVPDSTVKLGYFAFGETGIERVIIPPSLMLIDSSFGGCDSLGEITVNENNPYFSSEDGVLYNKDKTEIVKFPAAKDAVEYTVPRGVSSVSDLAFAGCKGIKTLTVPDGVTSIGSRAFADSGIESAEIADSVTSIGDGAFYRCEWLRRIRLPEGLGEIEREMFTYCEGLSEVNIPSSVREIGTTAFFYCISLKKAELGDSIKKIGGSAFALSGLSGSITIPEGTEEIGGAAFSGCSGITGVSIPDSVRSIGSYAFEDTKFMENKRSRVKGPIYVGHHLLEAKVPGDLTVAEGTLSIAGAAFSGNKELLSVTVPDTVTEIADSTFSGCEKLSSVKLSKNIKRIGERAFEHCTALTEIELPDSLTEIGEQAFYRSGLTSVTVPESVSAIGYRAFGYCEQLSDISLPPLLTDIDFQAFVKCAAEKYEDGVFYIGSCLVGTNGEATDIRIKEGTTSIAFSAIGGNGHSIEIPESVEVIGDSGIWGDVSDISVNKNNKSFIVKDGALFTSDGKTLIKLTGEREEYRVPDGAERISSGAFTGTGVKRVYLPDTLKELGKSAFSGCFKLDEVFYDGTQEEWKRVERKVDYENGFFCDAKVHFADEPQVSVRTGNEKTVKIAGIELDLTYDDNGVLTDVRRK